MAHFAGRVALFLGSIVVSLACVVWPEGTGPGAVNIPAHEIEGQAVEIRRMGKLPILYCG